MPESKNLGVQLSSFNNRNTFREVCLLIGMLSIIGGCFGLYFCMEENWAEDVYARQRVLILAAVLLISTAGVCYYATKTEPKPPAEVEILLIENPPSYSSIVIEEPPPSYSTIIQTILVRPQQSTG